MSQMERSDSKGEWFDGARFGMFVHWTHISTRGFELSWPMVGGSLGEALPNAREVPVSDYYAQALDFRPRPGAAKEWMGLAAAAGMRYAVLTTKHHDGFALWPTEHTDFSIAQTPYDGDLVGEYVEAAREAGLRVGFYYSLSDWHHPDYPAFTESDKPYLSFLGKRSETWEAYLEVLFGQVTELLSNYGTVDLIWFDGQWERSADEWKAPELAARIRELQPDILINDRLPGQGDFATPEQSIPAEVPEGRWETCLTMNRSWGYVPWDESYKSAAELIHTLTETAGRGGNFLLNVSPRGDGSLPPEQVERLEAVAGWMETNAEAIYDTEPGLEPWQFYGPSTRKGDRVFLHCVMRAYEQVLVRGLPIRKVRGVRILGGDELAFTTRATAEQELLSSDPIGEVVIPISDAQLDPICTVLELHLPS